MPKPITESSGRELLPLGRSLRGGGGTGGTELCTRFSLGADEELPIAEDGVFAGAFIAAIVCLPSEWPVLAHPR